MLFLKARMTWPKITLNDQFVLQTKVLFLRNFIYTFFRWNKQEMHKNYIFDEYFVFTDTYIIIFY